MENKVEYLKNVKKEYNDLEYQNMVNDYNNNLGENYKWYKINLHSLKNVPSCCNKQKRYEIFLNKYSYLDDDQKPKSTGKVNHILSSFSDFINCFLCIKGYSLSSFYGAIVVILVISSLILQSCSVVFNIISIVSPENSNIFLIVSVALICVSQILISISGIFKKLSDYEKDVAIAALNGKSLSKGVMEDILENRSKQIIETRSNKNNEV